MTITREPVYGLTPMSLILQKQQIACATLYKRFKSERIEIELIGAK